jgi:hypothetical protein
MARMPFFCISYLGVHILKAGGRDSHFVSRLSSRVPRLSLAGEPRWSVKATEPYLVAGISYLVWRRALFLPAGRALRAQTLPAPRRVLVWKANLGTAM